MKYREMKLHQLNTVAGLLFSYNLDLCSGVTRMGGAVPGRSRRGGAKHPLQKYFIINKNKSEHAKVVWMRQK